MIQIQNITVRNFKNIESADLDLTPINVIIGPNGSGKTNFLMVLSVLKMILRGSNDSVESLFAIGFNLNFGAILPHQLSESEACNINISLKDTLSDTIYHYGISIRLSNDKSVRLRIGMEELSFKKKTSTGLPTTIFFRNEKNLVLHKKIKKFLPNLELKGHISGLKPIELIQDNIEPRFRNAINAVESILNTPTFYLSSSSLKSHNAANLLSFDDRISFFDLNKSLLDLEKTEDWDYFKGVLKSITGLQNVQVSKVEGIESEMNYISFSYFNHTNLLHELSDGMVLTIGLLLKIMTSKYTVIFLEEPENSIHPKALSNLMSFLRSRTHLNQFIISTHSSALLNLISPEEVFVSHVNISGLASIAPVGNVKELKSKLNKGFISFGDLLLQNEENEFEDIF